MSIYRGRSTTEFYLASVLYDSIEDYNKSGIISLLSEKGANANIVLPKPGISPFHLAIGSEDEKFAVEVVRLILQHGGNPNVCSDEGLTPLHIAAAWGRQEIVELLLCCGANPDIQDYSYQTPVDYALGEGHLQIATSIKQYINRDVSSYFNRDPKSKCAIILEKILVNNGQAIAEYEVSKDTKVIAEDTIDLEVLPQTNPNDYVLNWCNTQLSNTHLEDDLSNSFSETPSNGSIATRPSSNVQSLSISNCSEKSRESGILTLPESGREELSSILINNEVVRRKNSKDTSSDYFTCTEVSENPLDNNVFEISSTDGDLTQAVLITSSESETSFISVSEVYKYTDNEEGVVLFEKRQLPITHSAGDFEQYTISSTSSKLSSLPKSFNYDTDSLRKELAAAGYEPGPITKTTKRVYLRKLQNIRKNPDEYFATNILPNKKAYSYELQRTLQSTEWTSDLTPYRNLEEEAVKQFMQPDPSRKWREGMNKCSFTYLLLDPRLTKNLPCKAENLSFSEQWDMFLSSIFYVGKGKRSRPYQHLYEAITLHRDGVMSTSNEKLQHILDIWRANLGVVCLHVFQNVIPVEAYTREAAMITAIKLENLKNIKAGEFYGVAATWTPKQKQMFGVYLLYKAMTIFINEGERQISPDDIKG